LPKILIFLAGKQVKRSRTYSFGSNLINHNVVSSPSSTNWLIDMEENAK